MFLEEIMVSQVIEKLAREIELADGQEVLATGVIDPLSGEISEIRVLARGNTGAAPAIVNDVGPGQILIHNHPSGKLSPSEADLRVASLVGNQGAGFLIIDNLVEEGYMVVEPHLPRERQRLSSREIIQFFEEGNMLSRSLGKYEYRPQQLEMVKTIIFALNNRRHLMVEAGTGTGKSMAYLVPALHWAVKNNEKVVVSTNTINLQEQLFYKDIPLLEKALTPILPREFRTVLVKGRRNYVCLRKLNFLNQGYEELKVEEEQMLTEVNHQVFREDVGSKSEFPFQPDADLWEKVASEAETCLRSKCPHYRGCFFQRARRETTGADLLIVNHHLLFADLAVRKERGDGEIAVLPKYKHLILDEAHNLEHVATEYLGYQLNRYNFIRFLQYIYNTKGKNQQGLLQGIRGSLAKTILNKDQKSEVLRLIDIEIIPLFLKVRDMAQHFFTQVADFFQQQQTRGESKLRLIKETLDNEKWQSDVLPAADDFIGAINQLGRKMTVLYDELEGLKDQEIPDYDSLLVELDGRITQLQRVLRSLEFITNLEDESYVYWMEVFYRRKDELYCTLQAAPLEIADDIREQVVEALDTVIFTSATLTVQNNFNYFRHNLGLTDERVDDLLVGSPFDYQKQALVTVVKDTTDPNHSSYVEEVQDHLLQILQIMKGRTLVLFTSYRMLNVFYTALQNPLEKEGIRLYKQGEGSRQQIINNFKEEEKGVIFGTSSFWEGIDIQGEDLSCVVITKLPFLVPSEPIVEARVEKLKREGKNPFVHFMLPNAVIKFKQGFGRLVRSKDDRGVVVVFDQRLYSKSYGRVFLNSLPKTKICVDTFDEISKRLKDFII